MRSVGAGWTARQAGQYWRDGAVVGSGVVYGVGAVSRGRRAAGLLDSRPASAQPRDMAPLTSRRQGHVVHTSRCHVTRTGWRRRRGDGTADDVPSTDSWRPSHDCLQACDADCSSAADDTTDISRAQCINTAGNYNRRHHLL